MNFSLIQTNEFRRKVQSYHSNLTPVVTALVLHPGGGTELEVRYAADKAISTLTAEVKVSRFASARTLKNALQDEVVKAKREEFNAEHKVISSSAGMVADITPRGQVLLQELEALIQATVVRLTPTNKKA